MFWVPNTGRIWASSLFYITGSFAKVKWLIQKCALLFYPQNCFLTKELAAEPRAKSLWYCLTEKGGKERELWVPDIKTPEGRAPGGIGSAQKGPKHGGPEHRFRRTLDVSALYFSKLSLLTSKMAFCVSRTQCALGKQETVFTQMPGGGVCKRWTSSP